MCDAECVCTLCVGICAPVLLFLGCLQACSHCHVESSPARTEMMDQQTAQRCLQLLADSEHVTCLDITGGAPELNSQFRWGTACVAGAVIRGSAFYEGGFIPEHQCYLGASGALGEV